jgi:hypothetical protein
MLAVSNRGQAQKIYYAVENSVGWSLVLRPVANAVDAPADVEGVTSVLKDGASSASLQHLTAGGQ